MKLENKRALLRHRGYEEYNGSSERIVELYLTATATKPPPKLLVKMDAAGVTAYRNTVGWHWMEGGRRSDIYRDLPDMLRAWEASQRPAQSHICLLNQGLTHYMDAGHRAAAKDSVPEHVTVLPTARVETTIDANGRITGAWVEARVFVSLCAN